MLHIDGSLGEGGGQVLRTALTCSMITGEPFRIDRIRARRSKPGLLRQHLTCVQAAAAISSATVEGAYLGSTSLTFEPGKIRGGEHRFAIGSAGSTTLVAETVLPALAFADGPGRIVIDGGTHNTAAPPFPFVEAAYLPLVRRMGFRFDARLHRPGFYPAAGGRIEIAAEPSSGFTPIALEHAGAVASRRIEAVVANLPFDIAEREAATARAVLCWGEDEARPLNEQRADGHGNVVLVTIAREHLTEVFSGFGQRGLSAEAVATRAAEAARRYLEADVAVGEHLADQLLLPMALARGGSFTTLRPSDHTRTNIAVIEKFLPVEIALLELSGERWRVTVSS